MNFTSRLKRSLAAITLAACFSFTANADLLVDFGNGSAVEAGFTAFNLGDKVNYNGSFNDFNGTGLDNGTDVRVTVSSSGTDINDYRSVVRNPTDWGGGSSSLLFDWIGMDNRTPNPVNDLTLTFDNLAAGNYKLKSYHTDIGNSGNQDGRFDLNINGTEIINEFQVKGQVSTAPANNTPNFLEVVFAADGTNPVDIAYLQQTLNSSGSFQVLNGFELTGTTDPVTPAYQPPPPPSLFQIDVDSSHTNPIATEAGWTSLDATTGNGSFVMVGPTTFTVFSADDDRNRATPNDLTGDFVFDDGAGQAVGLTIDDLPAGRWLVEVWAWDSAVAGNVGPQILGLKSGPLNVVGNETLIPGLPTDPVNPIGSIVFDADGTTQYHVFTREDNPGNQSRFNALRLTIVPEPTSLLVLGTAGLLAVRRRRHG